MHGDTYDVFFAPLQFGEKCVRKHQQLLLLRSTRLFWCVRGPNPLGGDGRLRSCVEVAINDRRARMQGFPSIHKRTA